MPPTRREQLELDELLSDIYRGIETLPDKSQHHHAIISSNNQYNSPSASNKYHPAASNRLYSSRTQVKEYELPASSPIVRQHKQELAALRAAGTAGEGGIGGGGGNQPDYPASSAQPKQPHRSTLKRHTNTNTPDQQRHQQPQSLASFVTSTTPENKRRVRIVDHPDKLAKGQNVAPNDDYDDYYDDHQPTTRLSNQPNVKYVNTNKLIYHQEQNPDDEPSNDAHSTNYNTQADEDEQDDDDDDDDQDIDGVTRVEYYHTTWLDRQLGRASKRRSSKELNERQVKEKAMIEELKRSLKNGAITLKQSFKGKKNNNKNKPSETYDDQMLDFNKPSKPIESRSVFGSGLATIPRNYHSNKHTSATNSNSFSNGTASRQEPQNSCNGSSTLATPKQTTTSDRNNSDKHTSNSNFNSIGHPMTQTRNQEKPAQAANYSRTLPHNYQPKKMTGEHQLLQSHYRGGNKNFNTINQRLPTSANTTPAPSQQAFGDTMRNPQSCASNNYGGVKSPTASNQQFQHQQPLMNQQQQQQQQPQTISSIPSATEVVRSALSRSSSQVSLNQLNKTINLLPTSPSPYVPSPMTPTQQLKAASPSLSPSPGPRSPYNCDQPINAHYTSKTLGTPDTSRMSNQASHTLHGARTLGKPPQQAQPQQQQQQQQQPVYANPHASLMQHRIDQQMKQGRQNNASIREFNELDSLLRSLSPSSTHITPGFSSKPAQPAFGGYGYAPVQPAQTHTNLPNQTDLYARVQKQQPTPKQPQPNYQQQQQPLQREQSKGSYLQQHYGANISNTTAGNQPFTIDVTSKKDDNCLQRQNLSEFEPPIELLPSMEDYQNISKLNPVKNHYWYKPTMSRDRAINLLKDKPQGTFIVRDSTSFRGAYGLAVKVSKLPKNVLNNANLRNPNGDPSSELIRHFLIEPTSNGVRLKGYANEPVFSSLPNLIYQHSLTELALPCKLVIPRADIEDPRFNQKQKQFYDEFLSSKEQAKHAPYERTSPDGGYRKYPGNVYVHNEHRIIFE